MIVYGTATTSVAYTIERRFKVVSRFTDVCIMWERVPSQSPSPTTAGIARKRSIRSPGGLIVRDAPARVTLWLAEERISVFRALECPRRTGVDRQDYGEE